MIFARFILICGFLIALTSAARAANPIADVATLCQANLPQGATMVPVSFPQTVVEYDPVLGLPPLVQQRYACVFLPSGYNPAAPTNKAAFFFHGGNGFAGKLMTGKDNIRYAQQRGFVAVFAQGWPVDACTTDLCDSNSWDGTAQFNGMPISISPLNVTFAKTLIETVVVDQGINRDYLFLAGFSGGAKLTYQMLANDTTIQPNGFTPRGVVTAAGAVVSANITLPGMAPTPISSVDLHNGLPQTPILMLQGGQDPRIRLGGGFDENRRVVRASFRTKVDMARLMNNARVAGTPPVLAQGNYATFAPAGMGLLMTEYLGDRIVVEVEAPTLKHRWPKWFAPMAFAFFDGL